VRGLFHAAALGGSGMCTSWAVGDVAAALVCGADVPFIDAGTSRLHGLHTGLRCSYQRSAVSHQPSVISDQPSAISRQLSAVSYQRSAISRQAGVRAFSRQIAGCQPIADRRQPPQPIADSR